MLLTFLLCGGGDLFLSTLWSLMLLNTSVWLWSSLWMFCIVLWRWNMWFTMSYRSRVGEVSFPRDLSCDLLRDSSGPRASGVLLLLSLQLPSSGCSFGLSGDFSGGFPLRLFCSFLLDWPLLRSLPLISPWHILRSLLSHIAWPLPGISSWPVLRSFYWPVSWTALLDANLLYWFWWWRCVQLDWNKSRGAFNLWHMYWSSRCGGFVVKKVVVVDRVL